MREIKFRAWDIKNKKMINEVKTLHIDKNKIERTGDDWDWYKREVELMQYTGLKDKNGVEIYEGDLLEDDEKQLYVVEHDKGCFVAVNTYIPGCRFVRNDLRLVGNIYEDKNLLD